MLFLLLLISYVVPSEAVFAHVRTLASYILMYSFIWFLDVSSLVIKMDPSAVVSQTCGPVLIKSTIKQGQSEGDVGENNCNERK